MASAQQQMASILPHITGFLSVCGNSAIIADICRRYRKSPSSSSSNNNKPSTYHRLMLGMSATSMSASVCSGLSTWPMPKGTVWQAFGNEGTCTAQAFFLQIGISAPFYNLALTVYFWLFIVKNLSSKNILYAEKFMHPICVLFGIGTAIASLVLGIFGNAVGIYGVRPRYFYVLGTR